MTSNKDSSLLHQIWSFGPHTSFFASTTIGCDEFAAIKSCNSPKEFLGTNSISCRAMILLSSTVPLRYFTFDTILQTVLVA